jgi:sirohydrochlorin ferrochelatase
MNINNHQITSSAYLLVVHGSRYFRYNSDVENLAKLVKQIFTNSYSASPESCLIKTAYLELGILPLSEIIYNFSLNCLNTNIKKIKVLPLFLVPGFHVKKDIPEQVNQAQIRLGNQMFLEIMPHLGIYKNLIKLLATKFKELRAEKRILLAHGSSLEKSNQECEQISSQLNAEIAYWSRNPSLSEKVNYLANLGIESLAILPYFLFEGKITKAIATQIEELKTTYPRLKILAGKPLGTKPCPELANLICQILDN